MFARDITSYALGSMKRRKLRTALTSLGVTMAIAVIIALLSITQGLESTVENELVHGLGTSNLTLVAKDGGTLSINDTTAIEGISGVSIAAPVIQRTGTITNNGTTVGVNIVGIDMDKYRQVYSDSFVAKDGSIPSNPSNDTIILGARANDPWLNGTISFPLGSTAEIVRQRTSAQDNKDLSYNGTVKAVMNSLGPIIVGAMSDSSVYIPIAQAQSLFKTDQCSLIIVKLADDSQGTKMAVSAIINDTFDGKVSVISSGFVDNVVTRVFSTLDMFVFGVAGITLFIAGICIMNTMTISLTERTREIGMLKSLGLKDREVLSIFLCEASLIGLIGSIIGVAVGYGLASVATSIINNDNVISWSSLGIYGNIVIVPEFSLIIAIMAVAFGAIVGIIFATYPAWRASKLSPMESLRHE
ncbi:MAG: FtsX-like permease family protein [Methanomassiliicoccus sp.]|nr:FtsX-like permease family protein [Methanomassiliicoccus sp.]